MAYDKQIQTIQRPEIIYHYDDLEAFNKEMEKYLIEKTLANGETIKIYDEIQYLKDQKASNQHGEVILTSIVRDSHGHMTDAINKYKDLSQKIDQWKSWKNKKEFIEKKKIEGLEELAQGMKI